MTDTVEAEVVEEVELTPAELAVREEKLNRPVGEIPITMKLIGNMSALPSMPKHYRGKPQEILAATLLGREIGIGPITSWNNIDLIDGSVSMRAKLMAALIERRGHIIVIEENTEDKTVISGLRYHSQTNTLVPVGKVEYTKEDAVRAGDWDSGTYQKHPKAMLLNRALTLMGRSVFADALMGFAYTADEIGHSDEPDDSFYVEATEVEEAAARAAVILDAEEVDA